MKTISRSRLIYGMSAANAPTARMDPGEIFLVETEDCYSHQVTAAEDFLAPGFDSSRANPATGPIHITGAAPGDVLKIHVRRISLEASGMTVAFTGGGPLGGRIDRFYLETIRLEDGHALFGDYRLPLRAMIGVIGVAPREGAVPDTWPGAHGGNLDTREIAEGARVYLPVFHDGALLAMGDIHAVMGDGEVCGTGVEIRGAVELQVEILKNKEWSQPMVESPDDLFFLGSAPRLEEAVELATDAAVNFLHHEEALPWPQAYMLASLAGQLMISQVVNPWKTAKMRVPKSLLKSRLALLET